MASTRASAIITSREIEKKNKPIIRTDNPSLAFAKIISLFSPQEEIKPKGIHPTAIVAKSAKLGANVALGAYTVIEEGVSIGEGSAIFPHVYIGKNTQLGSENLIYPNVTIRENTVIGNRVIIHSGTVIGSDGFGYVELEGRHEKIPQLGKVVIEDDVEIGACVTIDRARFDKTLIAKGTKIDNLVQIAHNVQVGENSIIIAQAGISGSTEIGKNVIIAGQAGLVGHIKIGDKAIIGAQAGVTKSVPAKVMVSGYPARPHLQAMRLSAALEKLPALLQDLQKSRPAQTKLAGKPAVKKKKRRCVSKGR
jgi:UDP-3-O-[3-hydroxymyristoyl] glucosamine N-acyltransferase